MEQSSMARNIDSDRGCRNELADAMTDGPAGQSARSSMKKGARPAATSRVKVRPSYKMREERVIEDSPG